MITAANEIVTGADVAEVIVIPALAIIFWWTVLFEIIPYLQARHDAEDMIPDPADVSQTEIDLGVRVMAGWEE